LTLAEQHKYELTYLKWPRSRGFNNVFRAARPINEQRLYPARRYLEELEEIDPDVIHRFEDLWAAYTRLQQADQSVFVPALLAYFASKNPSSNYATISTVGYVASLAALSKPLRQRCPGQLTCSIHGALNWLHDETSETNAITQTILTSCGIDDEAQRTQVKRLVNRVYREQRSAFVHSAQLRHAEYSQGAQIPPAIPSNEGPTSDLFVYQEDLTSIGNLTRRTLIEWLMRKSGLSLDRSRMQINSDRVLYRTLVATSVTMAAKVITRVATQGSSGPVPTQG
jgi:hypothetical protein